jgi:hypothetical protein
MNALKIVEINSVIYSDHGFYPKDQPERMIEWREIIRVAAVFLINDVALESRYYWAFQTMDPFVTYWVLTRYHKDGFDLEVKNRFGDPERPHNTKWNRARVTHGELSNYVIWPSDEIGKEMYVEAQKGIWELDRKICYSKP